MSPDCTIREAVEADLPEVRRIYGHYAAEGTATFEESVPEEAEMARRWIDLSRSGFPWLVAQRAGRVIGYAYASPYRMRSGYRFTCEDSVYLDPAECRHGVGTALVTEVIARCEAGGWRQMVAVIGDSGNTGSIRLHSRLGFQPVGTIHDAGYKLGRWIDVVLMQRELGAGGRTHPRERVL